LLAANTDKLTEEQKAQAAILRTGRPDLRRHPLRIQTDQELERRLLAKLNDDQRTAKAGIALIVSTALPKSVEPSTSSTMSGSSMRA